MSPGAQRFRGGRRSRMRTWRARDIPFARRWLAASLAALTTAAANARTVATDFAVPTVMDAGGNAADPAVYQLGVRPGVEVNFGGTTSYLGKSTSFNRLVIENGAHFTAKLRVGDEATSGDNSILVSGPGSSLSFSNFSALGLNGPRNRLRVENGARVGGDVSIGYRASSTDNEVVVTGEESRWTGPVLSVGGGGSRNRFTLRDGADLEFRGVGIGGGENADDNLLLVEGSGAHLDAGLRTGIGGSGKNNRLEIREGATALLGLVNVGSTATGSGHELRVDGPGSRVEFGQLFVGGSFAPDNRVVIRNHATASGESCHIGSHHSAHSNQLRIENPGSSLSLTGELVVGLRADENLLHVTAGGTLRSGDSWLGLGQQGNPAYGLASSNRVTIEGPGSTWTVAGDLGIGAYGTGNTLEIRDGGIVIVDGSLAIDELGRGDNRLRLDGGYLAWKGDHTDALGAFTGRIADTRSADPNAFGFRYFADESTAQAATGYPGLGGHTLLGVGEPQVPAPITDWTRRIDNPNDNPSDDFAKSLAVRGHLALVGAPQARVGITPAGAAYLIDLDSGETLRTFHQPTDGPLPFREEFGAGVALTVGHVIVSAPRKDVSGLDSAGSVFVFDIETGELVHELQPEDPSRSKGFGTSLSVHGGRILIGAPWDSDGKGCAYLFDLGSGTQLAKLTGDRDEDGRMGGSVALGERLAVVAAPRGGGAAYPKGEVWLFDLTDLSRPPPGILVPHPRLEELDYQETAEFGASLALEDGLLLVGAPGENQGGEIDRSGAAYLFDLSDPGSPRLLRRITADRPAAWDSFGSSLAISEGIAVISNPFLDLPTKSAGGVVLFDLGNPEAVTELGRIAGPPDGFAFGQVVAIDRRRMVAGTGTYSNNFVGSIHSHVFPDLEMLVEPSASAITKQPVTHTLIVSNPGPVDVTELVVGWVPGVPPGSGISGHPGEPSTGAVGQGRWSIPRLRTGESASLTITYQPSGIPSETGSLTTTAAITGSHELLVGRDNDNATAVTTMIGTDALRISAVEAFPTLDRQTGLMVQRLRITNLSEVSIGGVVLAIDGFPENTRVMNATTVDETGRPLLELASNLAPGATTTIAVEFFSPTRQSDLRPDYQIVHLEIGAIVIATTAIAPPPQSGHRVRLLPDGRVLVEFEAMPGRRYQVEYSHDLEVWQPAGPVVTSPSADLRWLDAGPPTTDMPPSDAPARFYRLRWLAD